MQYIDQNSPQIINEGYKIWKKNVPALYNVLQTYELESCSQTIDWLSESFVENNWKCINPIIGTNVVTGNAVYVLNVHVPTAEATLDVNQYSEQKPELEPGSPGFVGTMGQQFVNIKQTIHQDSEVMRVRVSKADPNRENLIAVKTGGSNPQLIIYDLSYQDAQLQANKIYLQGHEEQGYGLSWNNESSNIVASCSFDRKILVYDISKGSKQIQPLHQIRTNDQLQQIKWMHGNSNIFCVGGQNKQLSIYDIREGTHKPSISKIAHNGEIYAVDFNRLAQNLLLSGSEDQDIYLWDIRNMSKKYNSFIGHNEAVTCLQWSPQRETEFVSGSADRKVVVWDIAQIGLEMTEDDKSKENKADEISFIHNGHRSRVTDVCYGEGVIGSCQESCVLQVWEHNAGI